MLTKEHKEFIATQKIVADKTTQAWIHFFEKIQVDAERKEKNRKFLRRMQLIWFLLLLLVVFGGSDLLRNSENVGISAIGLLLIFILIRVEMARNKSISAENPNFLNHIQFFVLPVISILEKDIKQNSTLHLELDLRAPFYTPELKKSTYKYNGWNVSFYQIVFIKLKATFEDKIILNFMIMDRLKKLERTKISASGRTKIKRKFKGKTTYIAKVAFPNNAFSSEETLQEKKGRIVKVVKKLQINTQENYRYKKEIVFEAIANAFSGIKKLN
ncbi:MAG: hypothetical protein OHK0045_22990 [Raineya sp.]